MAFDILFTNLPSLVKIFEPLSGNPDIVLIVLKTETCTEKGLYLEKDRHR